MMETGKMTAVVDLVHTVFLKAVDIEKFIQGDGKMIRDMYVFVILAVFFFFFNNTSQVVCRYKVSGSNFYMLCDSVSTRRTFNLPRSRASSLAKATCKKILGLFHTYECRLCFSNSC